MKNETSRRNFITSLFMGVPVALAQKSPIFMLLSAFVHKAYGIEESMENNYIGIMMSGGPPRWMFDLPLTPNGSSDHFEANPMLITQIVNNNARYATQRIGSYYMPMIWTKNIPRLNGSAVSMSSMLRNMIMFRGCNLGVDGHEGNRIRHFKPNQSAPSIDGMATEKSKRAIPNVAIGRSFQFNSPTGKSQITVSGGDRNPLTTILSNFQLSGSRAPASISDRELESAMEELMFAIEQKAHKDNIALHSSFENRANAKKLFKKSFGNLKDHYDSRFADYRSLERLVFNDSRFSLGSGIQEHSQLRRASANGNPSDYYKITGFGGGDLPPSNFNPENSLQNNTAVSGLAHTLTIAEFLLKENLSTAATLNIGSLTGLNYTTRTNGVSNNDAHRTGALMTMFYFSKYYQAISACLNEFKTELTRMNKFDKTVIQLSGDFNRNAKTSGAGSDHGWQGSNTTVYSGMIERHQIVGNIEAQETGGHRGSWGKAGPMQELDNQDMAMGNIASSISIMLGCKTPTPNSPSLVRKTSSNKILLINNMGAKNVKSA